MVARHSKKHDVALDRIEASRSLDNTARGSLFQDPLVRGLSIVLALVVVMFLSTVAAALYLGILGSDTPKTGVQRDLQAYQAKVDAGSTDAAVWGGYVAALIEADQLRRAQQVIEDGLQVVDNRPGADLTLAQARVDYSTGDYGAAVKTCTDGIQALEAYHEAQKAVEGSAEQKKAPISPNYWELIYIRGLSYTELGEFDKALADYDAYLAEVSNAADVLALRGDVKLALGDEEGAEADFRRALVFIEDNQVAIDGLKKLGVE